MKAQIRTAGLLLMMFCFSGCISQAEEITRVLSPDSKVEAVLVRYNSGATASFVYRLFLVEPGGEVDGKKELFKADQVEKLNIVWEKPKLLFLKFQKGRIFHFSNFWNSRKLNNFEYVVELRLFPSSEELSLERQDS